MLYGIFSSFIYLLKMIALRCGQGVYEQILGMQYMAVLKWKIRYMHIKNEARGIKIAKKINKKIFIHFCNCFFQSCLFQRCNIYRNLILLWKNIFCHVKLTYL